MRQIFLIGAVGKRGQLGLNGKMPWHDPLDLQWFKQLTTGAHVVMGAATLEANPHLILLPARYVHRDDPHFDPLVLHDRWITDGGVLWVAGGAKTYRRWLPHVSRCMVSKIDYDGPADVLMPPLWEPYHEPD